jgi:parvulin-like peptidyl-prolyl isomerase
LGTPVGDFEAGELIAVVGPDHILAGEMFPMVDSVLSEYADKMPKEQMLKLRREYVRPALKSYIPTKVMYLSFFKQMAGKGLTVAQQTDAKTKAMARGRKIFYEQRIPQLLESNSAVDLVDLDRKLQDRGFSVSIMEKQFIETVMAQQVVQMQVPEQPQVLLSELRSEYDAKPEKWERPARAKWRQITVRFEKDRSREQMQEKIALLGNSIFIGGAPFESVAKQSSEGFTAAQGGLHDWTVQGSLKSEVLDKAIFTIPLRRLSSIIEDEFGMHIIEVLEREEARKVPFEESQKDLQEELRKSKREKLIKEVQDKAMDTMPIWTKWPEDIPGSRPLSEITGEVTGG